MGEGWETARRRDPGNDWVEVALACEGVVTLAELDTSYFLGNAPGTASLTGRRRRTARCRCCPRTRLQPDTRHRFVLDGGDRRATGCGWTSSPTAAWPGCGSGAGRPPPAGRRSAGAGSTRCPTSRRWRCSALSGCRRRRPAGWSGPARWRASCRRRSPGCSTARRLSSRANRWRAARASIGFAVHRLRGAAVPDAFVRWPSSLPARRPGGLRRQTGADGRRRSPASAEDALEEQIGARPDISCPDDVDAEVGRRRPGARSPRATTRPSTA